MNVFKRIIFISLLLAGTLIVGGGNVVYAQVSVRQTTPEQGIQSQEKDRDQIRDPETHDGDEPIQDRDQIRLQNQTSTITPTTSLQQQEYQQERNRIQVSLESTTTPPATTPARLQEMIQTRERELAQEASTTAQESRNVIQNVNQVRLAVHTLLSSRDLIGGIGPQVSQIAQQINSSVQATVNAEAQIQERGFWRRLFLGGDSKNAGVLEREVEQNQERIQKLEQLIIQNTGISTTLRETLEKQLQLMKEEQERLGQLADREQSRWGIFSWRF